MPTDTTSNLYLCCDCGGSKTAVAIADSSGTVIAHAFGGPSNFAYLGLENFVAEVKITVERALATIPALSSEILPTLPSEIPLFAAAWLGISGVDSPANVAVLAPVLSSLFSLPVGGTPLRLNICNDTHLLAAPLALHKDVHYAVGVIGGTGSITASFKQDAHGTLEGLARTGGWGWILGDEGGGFHVGREAVRHLLREYEFAILNGTPLDDAAPPSSKSLRAQVLQVFGVSTAPELLALIHDPDPEFSASVNGTDTALGHRLIAREKRLSQLSPYVFSAAFEANDALALAVLRSTADALAEQVATLLRPDSESESENSPRLAVPASDAVVCFGGSLVGVEKYRDMVLDALRKRGHVFKYVEVIEDAAVSGVKALFSQFSRRAV